jgi:hypothetical protein
VLLTTCHSPLATRHLSPAANWFCSATFYHRDVLRFAFHWPLATGHWPPFSRHSPSVAGRKLALFCQPDFAIFRPKSQYINN